MFGFSKKTPSNTPKKIGYLIASGVHSSCTQDSFSAEQMEIMRSLNMPTIPFWKEVLALASCRAEHTFLTLLKDIKQRDEVSIGYWVYWHNIFNSRQYEGAIRTLMVERMTPYSRAFYLDDNKTIGILGSAVQREFDLFVVDFIPYKETQESIDKDPAKIKELDAIMSDLYILTSLTVSSVQDIYFMLSAECLADGGLIRRPT